MANTLHIKEHMDVLASDGQKVGKVDHFDGTDTIKLTKNDAPDGKHHLIPVSWIDHVDTHVHLKKAANEVTSQWSNAA